MKHSFIQKYSNIPSQDKSSQTHFAVIRFARIGETSMNEIESIKQNSKLIWIQHS